MSGCQCEGLLSFHPGLIGLSVQVLYPSHCFCIRNLSKVNLSRCRLSFHLGPLVPG